MLSAVKITGGVQSHSLFQCNVNSSAQDIVTHCFPAPFPAITGCLCAITEVPVKFYGSFKTTKPSSALLSFINNCSSKLLHHHYALFHLPYL